jgi:hypothetical protein
MIGTISMSSSQQKRAPTILRHLDRSREVERDPLFVIKITQEWVPILSKAKGGKSQMPAAKKPNRP